MVSPGGGSPIAHIWLNKHPEKYLSRLQIATRPHREHGFEPASALIALTRLITAN
jgi:hypothetical protein